MLTRGSCGTQSPHLIILDIVELLNQTQGRSSVSSQLAAPLESNGDVAGFKNLVPFGFGMHYDFFSRLTFLIIFHTA